MFRAVLSLSLLSGVFATPFAARADDADGSGEAAPTGRFEFGSYGRVVFGGDGRGGSGKVLSVVSHAPRLQEPTYIELDFRYAIEAPSGARFSVLTTTALTDALFHLDGDFDGAIALRNAYVEAADFAVDGLSAWAGSRMYRGDDVYLLDFWPLDNLNTVGGGVGFDREGTSIDLHAGINQVGELWQTQVIEVPDPVFGTEELIVLDRIRRLTSLRVEQRVELTDEIGAKGVIWADYQAVGDGVFRDAEDEQVSLPADSGYTIGGQVGAWGFGENAWVNLFGRYSRGLAAYGELAVPDGFDPAYSVSGATLGRLALSANWETQDFGVLLGGYVDRFRDANDINYDAHDYLEGSFALRPVWFATEHVRFGAEASYQRRSPDGLDPRTDTYLEPAIWKVSALPSLALARGSLARPELRFIYTASFLNDGARATWPVDDPRAAYATQHYVGAAVEWWFNSSAYR
jgi:maltoporin